MFYNGRLLLLVLACLLFGRVWSANQPPRASHRKAPEHGAGNQVRARSWARQPDCYSGARLDQGFAGSLALQQRLESWTEANAPFAIPGGLPAGEFMVVDNSGRAGRLVIRDLQAGTPSRANASNVEFQSIDEGGRRWYLIRLQPVVTALAAPKTPNRKFDFSGY